MPFRDFINSLKRKFSGSRSENARQDRNFNTGERVINQFNVSEELDRVPSGYVKNHQSYRGAYNLPENELDDESQAIDDDSEGSGSYQNEEFPVPHLDDESSEEFDAPPPRKVPKDADIIKDMLKTYERFEFKCKILDKGEEQAVVIGDMSKMEADERSKERKERLKSLREDISRTIMGQDKYDELTEDHKASIINAVTADEDGSNLFHLFDANEKWGSDADEEARETLGAEKEEKINLKETGEAL